MLTTITAILASFSACRQARQQSAELWIGGDVNLGDGGKAQLQNITGMVQGASGIVSLEGAVTDRLETKDYLRLWNAPTALAELSAAQVKVAGLANNHAFDAQAFGPEEAAKELRDRGILPAGAVAGTAWFEVNGVSVAVTAHDLTRGVPENLETDLAA